MVQGLEAASWPDAFEAIKKGLEGAKRNQIAAIAGKLADAESMVALKVPPTPSLRSSSNLDKKPLSH
jgi:NADH-quinone oxidoreductase subunit G